MGIYEAIRDVNQYNAQHLAVAMIQESGAIISYDYKALFQEADAFAKNMIKQGILPKDRIVIVGENSPQWQMAFLAVMQVGCTAVLIDASLAEQEIIRLMHHSDGRGVFTSSKLLTQLPALKSLEIPVFNMTDQGKVVNEEKIVRPLPLTLDGDEEVAIIIYSSGTTKLASGIMHTHEAMLNTIHMTAQANGLTKDERILSILPNSHIYGVVTCLLGAMMLGASLYYVETISGQSLVNAFKACQPTVFPSVPKVFELFEKQIMKKIRSSKPTKIVYEKLFPLCYKLREKTGINLGKVIFKSIHEGFGGQLKIMTSAGAPIDPKAAAFYYGTGFNLLITYGLTETNIPIVGNRGKNITTDSCGTPYPDIELKLNQPDEQGEGEIYIKSPYMMKGYFRDQAATAAAFEDGWFKTGDVGQIDDQENLRITGRSKENIVLATGKKVTPTDIENKYSTLAGIKEMVACGVPVENKGYDEVHVFIVKEDGAVEADIMEAIKERGSSLSLYMKVAKVHFIDEVPKTSLQKPKRYVLKMQALQQDAANEETQVEEVSNEDKAVRENESIEETVRNCIVSISGLQKELITRETKIFSQLGIDSLAAIELANQLGEIYKVEIETIFAADPTVAELIHFIEAPQPKAVTISEIYIKRKQNFHYNVFKAHALLAHFLYDIKVHNAHHIPENAGYIICANHVSNFDFLWLASKFKKKQFLNLSCMGKAELVNASFVSRLLTDICGIIPVERGRMSSEVLKCCRKQLNEKWGILIYPEGTRSHDGKLGKLKLGAATIARDANVPIIPAYIKGAHEIFPRGQKMPNLFNWRKMRRYNVEVVYGEPIYPGKRTPEEITALVEQSLIALG